MRFPTTIAVLSLGTTAFAQFNITLYSDENCSDKIQDITLDVGIEEGAVPFNVKTSKPILSINNYATYPNVAYACWDVDCKNGSAAASGDGQDPCIGGYDSQDNKTVALVSTGIGSF